MSLFLFLLCTFLGLEEWVLQAPCQDNDRKRQDGFIPDFCWWLLVIRIKIVRYFDHLTWPRRPPCSHKHEHHQGCVWGNHGGAEISEIVQHDRSDLSHGTSSNVKDLNRWFFFKYNFHLILFSPDTSAFIQKMEKEKEARDRGETKDTRSFLTKYVRSQNNFWLEALIFYVSVDVHCASGDICPDIVGSKPRSGSWRWRWTVNKRKLHTHSLKEF